MLSLFHLLTNFSGNEKAHGTIPWARDCSCAAASLRRLGRRLFHIAIGALRTNELEVLANRLPVPERDRLAVENGFGHLAVLLVNLAILACGLLPALGRVGGFHVGGT